MQATNILKMGFMDNFSIIYFGNDWFGENRTSSHHIAQRLAKNHRVLYVECPGLRMPKGNKRDIKKLFSKIAKCISKPIKVEEDFWVYTLFQIPLHRFGIIRKLNEKLILFSLKRVSKQLRITQPLLWFLLPHLSMIPGKLPARGTVYYCIDNYSTLPDVDRVAVQAMDDEMTRKADLVFAASIPVFNNKKPFARELLLSPHGVDFQHFNQVRTSSLQIPEDITYFKAPIIGFWGLIENWIDLDLVKYLATQQPSWQLVMIGHVAIKDNPCIGLANVHFLGPKKFAELPAYACAFDVAILPYLLNEQVYNCNPIKLREYLATGKPVVSVRYPEVEKYQDVVAIADDHAEFEYKIAWYLENDTLEMAERRVEMVRTESWDKRVDEILQAVYFKFETSQNT